MGSTQWNKLQSGMKAGGKASDNNNIVEAGSALHRGSGKGFSTLLELSKVNNNTKCVLKFQTEFSEYS